MAAPDELLRRANTYTQRHGLVLGKSLGAGVQGSVFVAKSPRDSADVWSAVKAHQRRPDYARERDVYRRLKEFDVTTVRGCHVPQLLGYDDELWVIEMTVVSQPFVLDFGGAYLDRAPDFSEEVMADWLADKLDIDQQVLYRQLMYLVVVQSTITALTGIRLRWQTLIRTGATHEILDVR